MRDTHEREEGLGESISAVNSLMDQNCQMMIESAKSSLGRIMIDMLGEAWIEDLSRGSFTAGFFGGDIKGAIKAGTSEVQSVLGDVVFKAVGEAWAKSSVRESYNFGAKAADDNQAYRAILEELQKKNEE